MPVLCCRRKIDCRRQRVLPGLVSARPRRRFFPGSMTVKDTPMKPMILLVGLLAAAAPALAQSRLYTNADLGKPLASETRLDPGEAAAILAPYQFRALPTPSREPEMGPYVFILPHDP